MDYAAQRAFLTGRLGLKHAFSLYDACGDERIGYYRLPDGHFVELFPKRALRDHGFTGSADPDGFSFRGGWLGSDACGAPVAAPCVVTDAEGSRWMLDGAGQCADGLFGVTLRCRCFEQTLAFYRDALGLIIEETSRGALARVASGQWIELIDEPYTAENAIRNRAFSHVALLTDDIVSVSQRLEARGLGLSHGSSLANPYFDRPYGELAQPGSDGSYAFYVMDPEGNDIEAMQYTEASLQCAHA